MFFFLKKKIKDWGGNQNFKRFMENQKIYVDKTEIIYSLINGAQGTALVINGPRRTGKSLLLTTIETMYTENVNWWKKHASNLWITQNKSSFFSEEPYPILRFLFGNCKNDEVFKSDIIRALNQAIRYYKLGMVEIEESVGWNSLIRVCFYKVIDLMNEKFQKTVVLLIDENDQPLINQLFLIIEQNSEETRTAIKNTLELMKDFYIEIKGLLMKQLEIAVICGNSMIAQTSLYSGFRHFIKIYLL